MGRLTNILEDRALLRWDRAARDGDDDAASLRALRNRARALRSKLDSVVRETEARLARPAAIARPLHTDWAWRPDAWRGPVAPAALVGRPSGAAFGRDVKVFHDCPRCEFSVRQGRTPGGSAFGLEIDVFHFGGTFLSLAVDLPSEAVEGLTRGHLVRLDTDVATERAVGIYARLNLRHGPNAEQMVQRFDEAGAGCLEFDLAVSGIDQERLTGAWVDVIFDAPAMNSIRLDDLTLSRRPRAGF